MHSKRYPNVPQEFSDDSQVVLEVRNKLATFLVKHSGIFFGIFVPTRGDFHTLIFRFVRNCWKQKKIDERFGQERTNIFDRAKIRYSVLLFSTFGPFVSLRKIGGGKFVLATNGPSTLMLHKSRLVRKHQAFGVGFTARSSPRARPADRDVTLSRC